MKNFALYVAMVLLQLSYGASVILVKIALVRGLNQFVFVAYRHIIAMFLLGPFAYVLERKRRPSLSYGVFAKIFLLSSLGTTIYFNVFYFGLAYTSPTVASALNNVIPILTFLMALLLRVEKVKIRSASGQAKVLGTIICIGGSLVFTFWRGGYQLKGIVDGPLINIYSTKLGSVGELRHGKENWLKGSCLILLSTIAWSGWLVLLGTISKVYPAQLSLNALICFIASLQSSLLALFFARNPLLWRLEWNVQLLTIIYCRGVELFLQWAMMQGVAMLLQNRYQRQRLYTRIALGKANRMDVVWGETAGVDGQLWVLCPILFLMQGFEAYVGLQLLKTAFVGVVSEWQITFCGIVLILMAVGNFINTIQTLMTKSRFKAKMKRTKSKQELD